MTNKTTNKGTALIKSNNRLAKNIIATVLLIIFTAMPAMSQVKFGIRYGMTINKLKFDREIINSDNRVGHTAGLVLDLNIPVIGLGVEASAMYTHRENRIMDDTQVYKRHFIDIPIYARYRLALPAVEKIVAPYVFTGPNISILFKEKVPTNIDNSKTSLSWDVGAGVDLFSHLRVAASYSIGMSKAMEYVNKEYTGGTVIGKDRLWTVSAAYMF